MRCFDKVHSHSSFLPQHFRTVLLQQLFGNCSSHYWALHSTVPLGSFWHDFPVVSHWRVLLRTPTNVASPRITITCLTQRPRPRSFTTLAFISLGTAAPFVPPLVGFYWWDFVRPPRLVGEMRIELITSRLSVVCASQLRHSPILVLPTGLEPVM